MRAKDWQWPKPYRDRAEARAYAREHVSQTYEDMGLVLQGLRLLARERARQYADGNRSASTQGIVEVEALEERYEKAKEAVQGFTSLIPVSRSHWQGFNDLDPAEREQAIKIADGNRSASERDAQDVSRDSK